MCTLVVAAALLLAIGAQGGAPAQDRPSPPQNAAPAAVDGRPAATAAGAPGDASFTIGPEDVLAILFWRDQEMSAEVTVRPDGMITLPLIRDVKAAGLTTAELADRIQEAAREFVTDAQVTVVLRQMNSRKVFITGEVARPAAYPLGSTMTVMQLIAIAGGLTEFADSNRISIIRTEGALTRTYRVEYRNVANGTKRNQNIVLKPGDTVVVPEK